MRFIRHPFFERDLIDIVDHIIEITQGDATAAHRWLDEVDALLRAIGKNPTSGDAPDLNPVENIWSNLRANRHQPTANGSSSTPTSCMRNSPLSGSSASV